MSQQHKTLSRGKVWCFAIGQLGWSILSALISSFLVSYYQPAEEIVAAGQPVFIPQGLVIFGILTILGAIISKSPSVREAAMRPVRRGSASVLPPNLRLWIRALVTGRYQKGA